MYGNVKKAEKDRTQRETSSPRGRSCLLERARTLVSQHEKEESKEKGRTKQSKKNGQEARGDVPSGGK